MKIRNICTLLTSAFLFVTLNGCGSHSISTSPSVEGKSVATNPVPLRRPVDPTPPQEKVQVHSLPASDKWTIIQLDQAEMKKLQDSSYQGHATAYMEPAGSAMDFVLNHDPLHQEFAKGTVQQELFSSNQVILYVTDHKTLFLHLTQPVKQGTGGIWIVDRYAIQ